jgi:hypothetical protein
MSRINWKQFLVYQVGLALLLTACTVEPGGVQLGNLQVPEIIEQPDTTPRIEILPIAHSESPVVFPESIGASEEMEIKIGVSLYCPAVKFERFLVERTDKALYIVAQGKVPGYGQMCTQAYGEAVYTYKDPGTVARVAPFEVFVNGKSYGMVAIK